ncbi:DUF6515 family protein [Pedobacter hartonius]|uniref:Glycine rich protein n=1 Tax=Pedobacter hartonius TaxID=425514 RepID=A0A1H4BF68_9SPHI|nr:DUF6515 family protein [Pedobacter hartonius]SEA46628.1 hypothetical protein SAMN05443550_103319 [Pedobacter hartonius]
MKTLRFKSVIILASLLIVSGFSIDSALAQGRGGRGGGGGFSGASRGGGGGTAFHGSPGRGISGGSAFRGGSSRSFHGGGGTRIAGRGGRGGFYGGGHYAGRGGFGRGYYGHGFGRPYYGYYNYYRPYLGFSLNILPFGYYPFFWGDAQYYYSGGLYYRQYDNEYKVVVPPVGAEVPKLPSDAQEVTINGETYYEYKGVYYSPVEKADGKTSYVIAGKDGVLNTPDGDISAGNGAKLGDVANELPEGAREVTVRGEKLYVSEDGVYYEAIQDGDKTTYKVVGI